MGINTRIYSRFEWWSVADCRCELCRFYKGKKKPCPLEVCAVEDIRQEALRRGKHNKPISLNRSRAAFWKGGSTL